MGLDLVELVIRFEDAFGVAIPDKVAADLVTPRKVTDYVSSQLLESRKRSCLTQQAFYFIRGKFVPALSISRRDFKPDTRLEDLVPSDRRREVWARMTSEIGPSAIPDLARPSWLVSFLSAVTLATLVFVAGYALKDSAGGSISFFIGLCAAFLVGYGGALVTRPWKQNFRRGYRRVGDLATYISVHRPHYFKKEWTREHVAQVVREIIVDETGVNDFTEDSDFIKDMHLD